MLVHDRAHGLANLIVADREIGRLKTSSSRPASAPLADSWSYAASKERPHLSLRLNLEPAQPRTARYWMHSTSCWPTRSERAICSPRTLTCALPQSSGNTPSLSFSNRPHVSVAQLEAAIKDLVNAYHRCDSRECGAAAIRPGRWHHVRTSPTTACSPSLRSATAATVASPDRHLPDSYITLCSASSFRAASGTRSTSSKACSRTRRTLTDHGAADSTPRPVAVAGLRHRNGCKRVHRAGLR